MFTKKETVSAIHFSMSPEREDYKKELIRNCKSLDEATYLIWHQGDSNLIFKLKDGSEIQVHQPERVGWEEDTPWLENKICRGWNIDVFEKWRRQEKGRFIVGPWGTGSEDPMYRVMIQSSAVADVTALPITSFWRIHHEEWMKKENDRRAKIHDAQDPDNLVKLYERVDELEKIVTRLCGGRA